MATKKIIITGAAGFIGTNLVRELNRLGRRDLILVDHLSPKKEKNIKEAKYHKYYERDEFLKLIQENKFSDISIIFHLGACSDTTVKDKKYLLKNNTEYSKHLFEYCQTNSVRMIYASSAATYGNGENGYSDRTVNLKPTNYYGLSKYLFDKWVLGIKNKPPQWVGLKFFNVYGPYEEHKGKMASMVYHGFNQIQNDGKMQLFKSYKERVKNGDQKRDFVYVKDIIGVILFFMNNSNISGIFNVGTGYASTFNDIASCLFQVLNIKKTVKFIDMPENIKGHYQYFTEADITTLRKTGYTRKFHSLQEGIRDYIMTYLLPLKHD